MQLPTKPYIYGSQTDLALSLSLKSRCHACVSGFSTISELPSYLSTETT